ncbi:MAG: Rpp14/Pop5 family protein [Haloferacaceae archaeon]
MKHLPKHLRPRWRYLGVGLEAWPDADVERGDFQGALWAAARRLLGDPGSAAADLSVLSFSFADGEGEAVVRARRGRVEEARAALACVDAVGGDPVGVHVRGVSGTVRACEERYLGRGAGPTEERHVVFENDRRGAVAREDAVDVRLPDGFAGATDLDLRHE